jgi:hypothetical protein
MHSCEPPILHRGRGVKASTYRAKGCSPWVCLHLDVEFLEEIDRALISGAMPDRHYEYPDGRSLATTPRALLRCVGGACASAR